MLVDLQTHITYLETTIEKQKREIEKLKQLIQFIQDASPHSKKFDLWVDLIKMSDKEKAALNLMIESVLKPDSKLRGCAYNQGCYEELMLWRGRILEQLYTYEKGDSNEVPSEVWQAQEEGSLVAPRSNILWHEWPSLV